MGFITVFHTHPLLFTSPIPKFSISYWLSNISTNQKDGELLPGGEGDRRTLKNYYNSDDLPISIFSHFSLTIDRQTFILKVFGRLAHLR